MLLFYATKPVGGVIGYGDVCTKFRQNQPLWPRELQESRVIWPLRFEFDVEYCLAPTRWKTQKVVSKDLWPRGGFQLLSQNIGKQLASSLTTPGYATQAPKRPPIVDTHAQYEPSLEKSPEISPSHEDVKEALIQIGKLQNFVAEPEYQFDIGKLDVVWRRVEQSVPTYVFEIQIGGNLYQALAKLKHAFDLWNSHVFLVSPQEDSSKAVQLLSGTFHEMRGRLKFVDCVQVKELLVRKQGYRDLEKELGILR